MKGKLWVQMLGLSLLISIVFSLLGLTILRWISLRANSEVRSNIYLLVANVLDSAPYPESIQMLEKFRAESPSLASNVWVVTSDGHIHAANTSLPLPIEWQTMSTPQHVHEISILVEPPNFLPSLTLVRLNAKQPTFALIKSLPNKGIVFVQMILFILVLVVATGGGLALTFLYLRKTSREAKEVMSRLHAGDLQARFRIRKMDEIGNLKSDFNAMADEIEKLVKRVANTELARKNLLQELSHDLRTPLTSLRTSVETLVAYREKMLPEQQQELLCVMQSELDYFVRLLDDLFFIADIAEPGNRGTIETIDLSELLNTEAQARQVAQANLRWQLRCPAKLTLQGDAHLMLRLLRNTLDNAAKHAHSKVGIDAQEAIDRIEITIADDGPGMSPEEMRGFGERRKHRVRERSTSLNLSLGLGSVIIKTIVELHGGTLRVQSSALDSSAAQGTRFIFSLPKRLDGIGAQTAKPVAAV